MLWTALESPDEMLELLILLVFMNDLLESCSPQNSQFAYDIQVIRFQSKLTNEYTHNVPTEHTQQFKVQTPGHLPGVIHTAEGALAFFDLFSWILSPSRLADYTLLTFQAVPSHLSLETSAMYQWLDYLCDT